MMKMMLAFFLTLQLMNFGHCQDDASYGTVIKEIFMKGSADGARLYGVYGFESLGEDLKNHVDSFVNNEVAEALVRHATPSNVGRKVKRSYNRMARDFTVHIPGLLEGFAEDASASLKRFPNAYKIGFNKARDAYYESSNEVIGSVRYTGHALWAIIKGKYYLFIEVPAITLGYTIGTTAVASFGASRIPLNIAWQVFATAFLAAANGVHFTYLTVASAMQITYAAMSTITASTITSVIYGAFAVYRGGKWVVTQPRRIFRPYSIKHVISDSTPADQSVIAQELADRLEDAIDKENYRIEVNTRSQYRTNIRVISNITNKLISEVKVGVKRRRVTLKAEGSRALRKEIKENYDVSSRREIRRIANTYLETMMEIGLDDDEWNIVGANSSSN